MSFESELDALQKRNRLSLLAAIATALVFAALAIAFLGGALWHSAITAPPSVEQQASEVAALEAHVLPVVRHLRASWYLDEGQSGGSIYWMRGNFSTVAGSGSDDSERSFDIETEAAFSQLADGIRASGVPTNRLAEAKFVADGTLKYASFHRRGGGISYNFTYIYSPGAKPLEWQSKLGPVVLTRIGESDWWFEQSPDD